MALTVWRLFTHHFSLYVWERHTQSPGCDFEGTKIFFRARTHFRNEIAHSCALWIIDIRSLKGSNHDDSHWASIPIHAAIFNVIKRPNPYGAYGTLLWSKTPNSRTRLLSRFALRNNSPGRRNSKIEKKIIFHKYAWHGSWSFISDTVNASEGNFWQCPRKSLSQNATENKCKTSAKVPNFGTRRLSKTPVPGFRSKSFHCSLFAHSDGKIPASCMYALDSIIHPQA